MAEITIGQLPALSAEVTDEFEVQRTASGASGKLTLQQIVDEALDQLPTTPPPAWGQITGVLSNQADLQAALDAKADSGAENTALWGSIGGTLSVQSDLQAALDLKADASALASYLPLTGGNLSGQLNVQDVFNCITWTSTAPSAGLGHLAANTDQVFIGNSPGASAELLEFNNAEQSLRLYTAGTIRLSIGSSGEIRIPDLVGTGTRDVQVLADGTLVAV